MRDLPTLSASHSLKKKIFSEEHNSSLERESFLFDHRSTVQIWSPLYQTAWNHRARKREKQGLLEREGVVFTGLKIYWREVCFAVLIQSFEVEEFIVLDDFWKEELKLFTETVFGKIFVNRSFVDGAECHCESMTTVGLELTSYIDPSLTWKTVSKGRNTSKRSRRSTSKNMKMVQEHEKRSPKWLNSLQGSETEKSNVTTHGRSFSGNMEHIPIKKRRLFFPPPSPPLPSPNRQEKCDALLGNLCTTDQRTCSVVTSESQVMGADVSNGSNSKNSDYDGNIDKSNVRSSNEARGLAEDFSGIDILAAAACSDRFAYSTDDAGNVQNQVDRLVDTEEDKFACDLPGNDIERVKEVCLANDGAQVARVNNGADDVCMSPINEYQNMKQNESVASTSVEKRGVECPGSPDSSRSDALLLKKESCIDLPNEVADKAAENSGTPRGLRLHWDLNTVMDEWGHPLDDANFDSFTQSVEAAPINVVDSHNLEDMHSSEAKKFEDETLKDVEGLEAKRSEETGSGNLVAAVDEVCTGPESMVLLHGENFTSVSPTISRIRHCSEVPSGLITSIIKENSSFSNGSNDAVETSMYATDSEIQPEVVNKDTDIDPRLSLGVNDTRILASEEPNNGAGCESPNEVAVAVNFPMIVKSEEHEIDFLAAPFSGNAASEVKNVDYNHVDDFNVRNAVDGDDMEVAKLPCQPTPPDCIGSSNCETASTDATESGEASCQVNNLNCKNPEQLEQISLVNRKVKLEEDIVLPEESQPSSLKNPMEELKDSSISLYSIKLEDMGTTLMTMSEDQAMNQVSAKETVERPTIKDSSESVSLNNHGLETFMPQVLNHNVAADAGIKLTNDHLAENSLGGGHGSLVSIEDSSKVNKNVETVTELEGGYDSHLEDGELREPPCWEGNEGEDGETEHVDYDSDNRDEIIFYEANDFVQLSGEDLAGECEKESDRLDNFSSAEDKPNFDKNIEENCTLQVKGLSSTVDVTEGVCTKVESSALEACSGANNDGKVEMDHKDLRSSIEADSIGKDLNNDPPCNSGDASACGRNLQFSDRRCIDPMRRNRSNNFDCMHHFDGPDEPLNRGQHPSLRMGRFCGRSWNPELKSMEANPTSEDDGERFVRASGDSSPLRGRRSRIISTSRNGYHFRRGSPGQRDGDYGMGMMKGRDISPDNYNPRGRFGRFNGMNRGFREGYRRPGLYAGPKSGGSGGPMLNRFGKRDRSFSPGGDRLCRKSRSRSRTRSPDFRSEGRMGRGRMPYQQANHEHTRERRFDSIGAPGRLRSDDCIRPNMRPMRFHDATTSGRGHDFEESDEYRRKPPLMRNHRRSRSRSRSCSPEFRSDARMGSMRAPYQPSDNIRDRRSPPPRVFRPDQRYENGGSPGRLRSDECLRPMMRPLRFPDPGQPGRGHECNNNNNNNTNGDDYKRKPRNIFERIHPIRHYNVEGGDGRRFPYDEEDDVPPTQNFRRNENYARAGDRRPVDFRGPREERGNLRYNNSERMFYSGPKQFGGMRDYSEEGITRRVRP
ncbi:DNA mismatch repair protein MutL [Bienertia sinuspersici]